MYRLLIVQGTWNWVDQTPFEYNNWQEGEPNHLDDFKYCAKIYETGVGEEMLGKWDVRCSSNCTLIAMFCYNRASSSKNHAHGN